MRRATCLLTLTIVTIFAAGLAGAQAQSVQLRIAQWHHFVPRYDAWFDEWARAWGEAKGIEVSVDHVNLAELPSMLAAAIDAGAGHSLFEMPVSVAAFIDGLHDLRDLNAAASERYGDALPYCRANAYLPALDKWYGFVASQVVNHGNYDRELWREAGYPEGPRSWNDLLEGGRAIYEATGVPVGIGISPEPDSEMALRSILWSFGGSVQDENENASLHSEATLKAVEYVMRLHREAMTDEVFGWAPPSNNQALIAGEASFILNPLSAYRSLQKVDAEAAAGIAFTGALAGPGDALVGTNVLTHVIPAYATGAELEAASQFLLDYMASYRDAFWHSELYNLPCYPAAVDDMEALLEEDPFGSQPADKLGFLATVSQWSAQLGYPGPANPAISQIYAERIIPNMFAQAALGELTAAEAVARAQEQVEGVFARWRERGLVGGG